MDSFDKWFTRFMYATEIIFLLASIPHIAAWFAHFDNPTDGWSTAYAYTIGYALALAIDGVAFMVLLAIQRTIKSGQKKNGWVLAGLLLFMAAIAGLSWFINWQYDIQFASSSFNKANEQMIGSVSVGTLNPIIGGCFQVLILAYALISRAIAADVKPPMTEQQFQAEKLRIQRERELKALRKTDNEGGLLATGRERLLGKERDAKEVRDERLNATVDFLRDAQELLTVEAEPRALAALASLLKLREKQVLPYLIAARSTISREQAAALQADSEEEKQADRDTDEMDALPGESRADTLPDIETPGKQLRGPVYITLDDAARTTGYSREYLQKLVRAGTLSTKKSDRNKLLTSSLNAYQASHKRTGETGVMPAIGRTETGQSNVLEFAQPAQNDEPDKLQIVIEALQENPEITDEELAEILHMQRPASARFWRLKATEILRQGQVVNA